MAAVVLGMGAAAVPATPLLAAPDPGTTGTSAPAPAAPRTSTPASTASTASPPAPAARLVPTDRPVTLRARRSARVVIPGGLFVMGSGLEDVERARALCRSAHQRAGALRIEIEAECRSRFANESPAVRVYLPTFSIDRHEVTEGEYAACVAAKACPSRLFRAADRRLPVVEIDHQSAVDFCRYRNGRLPTEAEWEKAARGPVPRDFPWGAAPATAANQGRVGTLASPGAAGLRHERDASDGFPERAPGGSFPEGASPYGVMDLGGNVWEWTATPFDERPPQASATFDPRGPSFATEQTIRGGGFASPAHELRTTTRRGQHPSDRRDDLGFRCAYRAP